MAMALAVFVRSAVAAPPGEVLPLSHDLRVRLVAGRDLVLEAKPLSGENMDTLARRLGVAPAVRGELTDDGFCRIPFGVLGDDARSVVVRNVFPEDRADGADWLHVARKSALPLYDEGLWQVAAWFTGDGAHFVDLMRTNGLSSPELEPGQIVRIPGSLLDRAFRPAPSSDDGTLVYGTDDRGEFAGYRLKAGEALYSAVVLRFTGRTTPEDVETLARSIASRSGIGDLTDIPVGWLVKIPLDAVEPEFLPRSSERRKNLEQRKEAMERELIARPPKGTKLGLRGVVVILDPGHGGMDPGTMSHGIWEHDYVFDVASRLKRELESKTGAKVYLTIDDPRTGAIPSTGDVLESNRTRTVLTTPPFVADENGETAVAVNLRWYLANSVYRRLTKGGTDPDRIVFVSLHADARHPSLRGAMVYVPGATYRVGSLGYSSSSYLRFKEVREQPHVSFPRRERVRSEAVSRRLAAAIVKALKTGRLPVQPYQPIRERVIRGNEVWLPAVLRGNAVPTKVLVEMVNLNNADDAALLSRSADRERLAEALAAALAAHFGPSSAGRGQGR